VQTCALPVCFWPARIGAPRRALAARSQSGRDGGIGGRCREVSESAASGCPPPNLPPQAGGRGRSRGTLPHVHPLPPLAREGWGGGASAATRSGTPPSQPPPAGGGEGQESGHSAARPPPPPAGGGRGRSRGTRPHVHPLPRSRGRVGVGAGRVRMPSPAPSTQKGRPKAAFPLQPGRAASARQALGDRRAQVARRLHRGHAQIGR